MSKYTPLHAAAKWGNSNMLKLLIDTGADVNARDESHETPLHMALGSENINIVKLLVEAGANVNVESDLINTPLHVAVELEFEDITQMLIDAGADVNSKDENGDTPLHVAIKKKNFVLAKILVDAAADVDARNNEKTSPLNLSTMNRCFDIFKLLVYAGSKDVSTVNSNGKMFYEIYIDYFLMSGHRNSHNLILDCLKLIIECTDVNILNQNKKNIVSSSLEVYYILIQKKISIDNSSYCNPIIEHIAVLKTLQLNVDSNILKNIFNKKDYNDYYTECKGELEKAKSTRLHNCWVTFFDLIVGDECKIVKFVGNDDLVKDYENRVSGFPIYESKIKSKMSKGIVGRKLLDDATNILSDYLPIFNPTHLIIRGILDTLTETDWEKLKKKKLCVV